MKRLLQSSNTIKLIEILFLFAASPIVLLLPISIFIKIIYVGLGVVYITLISIFIEKFQKVKLDKELRIRAFKHIAFRFLIIVLATTLVLYYQNKEDLFNVIVNKPDLWLKFSGVYILFSVIPQELIYRTFFVKRYQSLVEKQ